MRRLDGRRFRGEDSRKSAMPGHRPLGPDAWLVVEGRHRVLGSWIAGRSDVLCVEVP